MNTASKTTSVSQTSTDVTAKRDEDDDADDVSASHLVAAY